MPHALPETALITGASSGIGLELARLFAADNARLILVARREEKLRELAAELKQQHGTESLVIAADLADPAAPESLVARIAEEKWQVDTLVNNAGFGQLGEFWNIPLDRHRSMMQLNMAALVELTYRCVDGMRQRRRGAILNLGSTASFQPGPHVAVYYATKAFVLSFSEALSRELKGTGVSVTCLCPGPTRTSFGDESAMHDTPVFKFNCMDVDTVARAGYRGLRRKKRVVIPGFKNKVLAASAPLTPRPLLLRIMERLQPLPK